MQTSKSDQQKQELYRDARYTKRYDEIWQTVGKCVFCDLNEKYIFFEENGIVMTISLYAYIDGHFMIVPRRHVRSIKDLSQLEWDTVRRFTYIAKKLIKQVHHVKGIQFIQKDGIDAQSTVEHLHFHCVPFDAPDLCTWHYRKLKYTPLENVRLYKQARKSLLRYNDKFSHKYQNQALLPVVCDLVAINSKSEVLLQKRKPGMKLSPDYLTLVGGHAIDFSGSLEKELVREVFEETGWRIKPDSVELLSSQISHIRYARISSHLKARYNQPATFLWNTYILKVVSKDLVLRPGDDGERLIWLPLKQAAESARLTDGVKSVLKLAAERINTKNGTDQ